MTAATNRRCLGADCRRRRWRSDRHQRHSDVASQRVDAGSVGRPAAEATAATCGRIGCDRRRVGIVLDSGRQAAGQGQTAGDEEAGAYWRHDQTIAGLVESAG
jgi:hypothetical protein